MEDHQTAGKEAEKENAQWASGGELGLLLELAAPEEARLIKKIGSLSMELDSCVIKLMEKSGSARKELEGKIPRVSNLVEKIVVEAVREIIAEEIINTEKPAESSVKENPDGADAQKSI